MHKNALVAKNHRKMTLHVPCALLDPSIYPKVNWWLKIFCLFFGHFTNDSFSINEGHVGGRDTVPLSVRNDILNDKNPRFDRVLKKKMGENIHSWNPLKKKNAATKSRARNLKELTIFLIVMWIYVYIYIWNISLENLQKSLSEDGNLHLIYHALVEDWLPSGQYYAQHQIPAAQR